jgi:uncharacterized peroxidase-related enzyme
MAPTDRQLRKEFVILARIILYVRFAQRSHYSMAHIKLPEGLPGIIGPLTQYPETGKPLEAFYEALMRGPSSLTTAERELIGVHVSWLNRCRFCTNGHAKIAKRLYAADERVVDEVITDPETASIGEMMKALLAIAGKVQQGGRRVTDDDVARARAAGADDKAIHDTVMVAALFCMANRYVDGLDTAIQEDAIY